MLKGKHIILGITGGIAAYKSAMLARLLIKAGAEVQTVMTPSAKEFITPVTMSALTGKPVVSEFFTANTGEWHSHVNLGLWADAMIIAPCTACTLGKMANGIADNMLVTTYLSIKAPVFIAPAMDLDMMAHPSTEANLKTLASFGHTIIEPECGELASHLIGRGRMAEPETIVQCLRQHFAQNASLQGITAIVTAGPTREKIDPVRYIGNYSSGKMGYALAEELASRGATVHLISGPVNLSPKHPNIQLTRVESAQEMLQASLNVWSKCNIGIMCAAVADFRPAQCPSSKIKRENLDTTTIELVKNPDIAATLGAQKSPNQRLIGFALETDDEIQHAAGKLARKGLDAICLNSLNDPGAGFASDTNLVTILTADGRQIPGQLKHKAAVAADIIDFIANEL